MIQLCNKYLFLFLADDVMTRLLQVEVLGASVGPDSTLDVRHQEETQNCKTLVLVRNESEDYAKIVQSVICTLISSQYFGKFD